MLCINCLATEGQKSDIGTKADFTMQQDDWNAELSQFGNS